MEAHLCLRVLPRCFSLPSPSTGRPGGRSPWMLFCKSWKSEATICKISPRNYNGGEDRVVEDHRHDAAVRPRELQCPFSKQDHEVTGGAVHVIALPLDQGGGVVGVADVHSDPPYWMAVTHGMMTIYVAGRRRHGASDRALGRTVLAPRPEPEHPGQCAL